MIYINIVLLSSITSLRRHKESLSLSLFFFLLFFFLSLFLYLSLSLSLSNRLSGSHKGVERAKRNAGNCIVNDRNKFKDSRVTRRHGACPSISIFFSIFYFSPMILFHPELCSRNHLTFVFLVFSKISEIIFQMFYTRVEISVIFSTLTDGQILSSIAIIHVSTRVYNFSRLDSRIGKSREDDKNRPLAIQIWYHYTKI